MSRFPQTTTVRIVLRAGTPPAARARALELPGLLERENDVVAAYPACELEDDAAVDHQVLEQLRRRDGDELLADGLLLAEHAFRDNACEYEKTGAFDPARQLRLAEACAEKRAQLQAIGVTSHLAADIPF